MTDYTEPGVEKIMEHTHAEYWDNTLRAAEGRYWGGLASVSVVVNGMLGH